MQSENTTKKFYPRETAVAKLYSENVRLQKLCAAHRKQIRGMQKALESATARLTVYQLIDNFPEIRAFWAQVTKADYKPSRAPTKTAEEFVSEACETQRGLGEFPAKVFDNA